MSRRQMCCVVHLMLTPKTPELQGMRCQEQNTIITKKPHKQIKLLSSCFSKRISPKFILLSNRNVFLVKAALKMVQKAVQLLFIITQMSGSHIPKMGGGTRHCLGKTCKMESFRGLLFQVPN